MISNTTDPKSPSFIKRKLSNPKATRHLLRFVFAVLGLACVAWILGSDKSTLKEKYSKFPTFTANGKSSAISALEDIHAELLGPATHDGVKCPPGCGCPETPVDCPKFYSTSDIQRAALLDNPVLDEYMNEILAVRTKEAAIQCGEHKFTGSGGWCLAPETGPKATEITIDGRKITLPNGHIGASANIVRELSSMIEQEGIKSISDYGAGVGQYKAAILAKFPDMAYHGYDGAGNIESYTGGFLKHFDLTIPLNLPKTDWVLSLEVGEHIPSRFEGMFLRNIHRHNCKGMILSWAILGQKGKNHINNHSNGYLLDVFEGLGYSLDSNLTSRFRRNSGNHSWFTRSVLVLRRDKPVC